jgi:hypothetical protein
MDAFRGSQRSHGQQCPRSSSCGTPAWGLQCGVWLQSRRRARHLGLLAACDRPLIAGSSARAQAVCVVHNETTTGVTSDIGGCRAAIDAAGHPALLLVDGVSSIGALDFR